jgi:MSHA pilin protein MshD
VTLVELVVSIVIIGIGVAGILVAIDRTTRASGDPMVRQQAIAVGEAYLEEILLKNFADPDQPESGGPEAGESRPTYDDVSDYNGLSDSGARDQNDNPIGGLGQYTVSVTVASTGLAGIPAADAKRVDVRVTGAFDVGVTLTGYRTNF